MPAHWAVRRLRTVAEIRVSNVDKHTIEDELPVRLCNYVDVYYNDLITSALEFMRATASQSEVDRFRLQENDVLITKDSETCDDIGVSALVVETADDLVCGYHLAMLRPGEDVLGGYLALALQTDGIAQQFHVEAQGVTRHGLTHPGIQSVQLPVPPVPEQFAIVEYIDRTIAGIYEAIAGARRQIESLREYRTCLISHVVTGKVDVRAAAANLPDAGADSNAPTLA